MKTTTTVLSVIALAQFVSTLVATAIPPRASYSGQLVSLVPENSPIQARQDLVFDVTVANTGSSAWLGLAIPGIEYPGWGLTGDLFTWPSDIASIDTWIFESVAPGANTMAQVTYEASILPQVPGNYGFRVHAWYPQDGSFSGDFLRMQNSPGILFFSIKKPGTAPVNNDFAHRTELTGGHVLLSDLTTASASKEPGEPHHAGNIGGSSVWFNWKAAKSGSVTIDLSGSGYDTLLAVYTGSAVNALTLVAQNDNDADQITSKVVFNALAGTEYRIAVDGFNGAWGVAQMRLDLDAVSEPSPSVTGPISLVPPRHPGEPITVKGTLGDVYRIEVSADFRTWTLLSTVENITGTVTVPDPEASNHPQRFYRVVLTSGQSGE